ncbi:DMT family transporter [Gemmobacter fulvus]|uniref:DMT family transporter n=1 Tax=Gemmobacter fulvus TaxID=2840474 RepID=A0A975P6I3_9RHOB|nr:DMT family transporter [Gemmobacter fulvus]MBT9244885.1 DMT family transporter [Gemmobacter fulvus]MDQ1847773.1 DMT family transporter [Gemmobacter fulvus]QWK90760.1 DMT family transporter [Gemmobacter fulvus]
MPQTDTKRGILLMLTAIAIFTTMDALAKTLVAIYPTLQVVWARYTGQSVIVALVFLPRLGSLLRTRYPGLQTLRSLFQFGATAFFFFSLGHIGLAEATAITDINPVLITLGAAVFLGEKLGPRRIFGVLAALAGALIIIRPGAGVFQPAALLPLCCAICYAGYAIFTRRVGHDEHPSTSLLYSALFGTLVTSVLLPFSWQPIATAHIAGFVAIGALGALAQFFLIRAFTVAEASAIAPFGYVGIVFATGWGILLFDEWPDAYTLLGALVIAGAGVYVWQRETRANRAR